MPLGRRYRLGSVTGPKLHTDGLNYVGSLVIDDVRVLITKDPAENLFLLLEAGISPDQWRQETLTGRQDLDLLPR